MKRLSATIAACAGLLAAAWAADSVAPQPTTIDSEVLDMWTVGNETRCIFTGTPDKQVTLLGTNLKILCDRLEIIAEGVGDQNSTVPNLEKFKYLLATGRVHIVQGDREAKCGRAEVFPREDKIVLTETPTIIDHGNDTRSPAGVVDHSNDYIQGGELIEMYRGDRRVKILKPRTLGPSIKDLGFDRGSPAPTSAAPAPAPDAKK